jgi:hypothetical protein
MGHFHPAYVWVHVILLFLLDPVYPVYLVDLVDL